MNTHEHPLSWKALIRIVTLGLVLFLIWKASSIFVAGIISLIISTALYPVVNTFSKKLPRGLAILLVLILLLVPFALLIIISIHNVSSEFPNIISTINSAFSKSTFLSTWIGAPNLTEYLQSYSGYLLTSTKTIVLTLTSILTVVFMIFYFLFDFEVLFQMFLDFFPIKEQEKIKTVLTEVAVVTGAYIRGNILISVISGAFIYVGLLLLNIPFALPLAIFAAIMDLLPLVG